MVKPATLARYTSCVQRFGLWLKQNGAKAPPTAAVADKALENFIEALWECGDPRGYAEDAVSGILFFTPSLRGKLPGAKRMCKAWSRAEIPNRAPRSLF